MTNLERILVVGGTSGTGLLIAKRLFREAYSVRVLARDPDRAAHSLENGIEIVRGDLTRPETLFPTVDGVDQIVFTAGAPSRRYAPERLVRQTDYQGVLDTLAAARQARFQGRFLYMNSIGMKTRSVSAWLINLLKRNTLVWRRKVEEELRASGVNYTIIRVGFLTNRPGGRNRIRIGQDELPLSPRHKIAREDVAEAFLRALRDPNTSRRTFEIVAGREAGPTNWEECFARLAPDP
jgi:uncharacterized protein YbjT (DUF2867 family)